jgi:surface polysaccharide O-acyltransferase-like enzyme
MRKRFARVAIPALFWFPLYSFYNYLAHQKPANFTDALVGLIEGPVHYHLWFIYLIIGLYLTYPIFAPFARSAKESEFLFFFSVCLFGTWGVKALWDIYHIGSMLYIETFTNNAIYFIGGYYLGHKVCCDEVNLHPNIKPWPISSQQIKWLALALIFIGFASTAGLSWYASKAQGSFFPFYYDYLNPTVTIGAVGLFLFARYFLNQGILSPWESDFSTASFGIYFAHPLLCDWWSESGYWQDKYHPALCIPVLLGLVLITTFMLVLLMRIIPGGTQLT